MAHSWPRTMGVLTRAWVHHDGSFRAEMPVPALDSLSRGAAVRGAGSVWGLWAESTCEEWCTAC